MIGTLRFPNPNCRVVFRGQMRTCSFSNCSSSLVQRLQTSQCSGREEEKELVCGALSPSTIKRGKRLVVLGSKWN